MSRLKNIFTKQRRKAFVDALLTPFSWLYGAGVFLRNTAFNLGLLKQEQFDVPVISIGNITVGGTGKTPHVEYIVEALCRRYNIAVLSRGYKRDTSGFILAGDSIAASNIGDEPYQIYHKFRGLITLAVCESRRRGIRELLAINPEIDLIVLDDAFQHRYVKPLINVVLIDYSRPPFTDRLLPLGNLREPSDSLVRSDMVVVTKCPADINPMQRRMMKENLDLFPSQSLFFSNIQYSNPLPVFPIRNPELTTLAMLGDDDLILGLTGIANAKPFVVYLKQFGTRLKVIHYDDHHNYTRDDFKYIFKIFDELEGRRKFIITTEKDAVRILTNPYFPPTMQKYLYYIPIRVGFLNQEGSLSFIEDIERRLVESKQQHPIENY